MNCIEQELFGAVRLSVDTAMHGICGAVAMERPWIWHSGNVWRAIDTNVSEALWLTLRLSEPFGNGKPPWDDI